MPVPQLELRSRMLEPRNCRAALWLRSRKLVRRSHRVGLHNRSRNPSRTHNPATHKPGPMQRPLKAQSDYSENKLAHKFLRGETWLLTRRPKH